MSKVNEREDHMENMNENNETQDYEVGYGKPPKISQFKKGESGNPSGRPKKPTDSDSEWRRELASKMTVIENGKRNTITKSAAYKRQTTNKAIQGNAQAIRVVMEAERGLQERAAELQKNSPKDLDHENLKPDDLTDEDLLLVIQGIHPKYSNKREADGQLSPKKKTALLNSR
jgi:hypothetical protein